MSLHIEQELKLDPYIPGRRGTADAIVMNPPDLHIVDLKYGTGVKVYAEQNYQLMIYALAAYTAASRRFQIERVTLHIVQPRLGHFDKWGVSPEDLLAFGEKVKRSVDACLSDDAPLVPSVKGCQWCLAQAKCPALYEHNVAVVGDDFDPIQPVEMTDEQLRLVLDNKALIEKWLKAVEAHVFSRLETGGTFEGYKMVEGRSQRRWADNAEDVLNGLLGEGAYDYKLIGIGAAEKVLGKKHLNELGITVKPDGKPTLVREDDPRKAISVMDDFDKL